MHHATFANPLTFSDTQSVGHQWRHTARSLDLAADLQRHNLHQEQSGMKNEENGTPRRAEVDLGIVVPRHGGGRLHRGGVPGNRGGSGATPSELRARLRGSVEERVTIMEQILDDPDTTVTDRIRCIDLLLKYGLGTAHEIGGVNGAPIGLLAVDAQNAKEQVRAKIEALRGNAPKLSAPKKA